ncbi:MAG: hypothetical protein ACK4OP_08305, partial [Gemmobacter sp.]
MPATALALALAAGPVAAQGPLSAIDWLSRSVATPGAAAAAAPPGGSPVDAVAVMPLDAIARDGAGVVAPADIGLPRRIWGATPADDLIALISAERLEAVPALRSLFVTLLLTAFDPPLDAGPGERFLLARIDKLLDMAALEPAEALIAAAGAPTAELIRRRFDIALLVGTEDAACDALRAAPGIQATYPTRVFCLARGGDWQAASLTLETARALGQVSAADDALLERFLDPELAEEGDPLPLPDRPTPLALRLFEAIGEPLPTTGLPLAFAHADLRMTTGWKGRLDAGERLARAGALDAAVLHALYTERRAAASGGVWDRVRAVQRLDAAVAARDAARIAEALPQAWDAMQQAEIEVPFAEFYAPALRALPLDGPAVRLAFRIALLAGEAAALPAGAGPDEAFLAGLARGEVTGLIAPDSLGRSIVPAFAGDPAALLSLRMRGLLDDDRLGEAILLAMERVAEGASGDRRGVTEGLAALRVLGLDGVARRAALQLM